MKSQARNKATDCVQMFAERGAGDIYSAIISKLRRRVGADAAVEDPKGTCVHVIGGEDGTAFAGVHPRKEAVLLNIRTQKPIKSRRVRKAEQVSRNRCHCEILLRSVGDVDDEVIGWLEEAANLGSA